MYKLNLPYPPSANRALVLSKGKIHRNKKLDSFFSYVWAEVLKTKCPSFPLEKRLAIEIYLYPPDKRMHDIDNRVRAVFNALQAVGVVENDFQFETLHVERRSTTSGGACEVYLDEITREIAL